MPNPKLHIISIAGIVLMLSLPLMPTLIYGMNIFDIDNIEVINMGTLSEEEDEKVHSVIAPLAISYQLKTSLALLYTPCEVYPPLIETHSPPPDQV